MMDRFESTELDVFKQVLSFIKEGNNEEVKTILEKNNFVHPVDATKATLLHYSVEYGNENVTQYLLDRAYHVNAQDANGTTPLMMAIRRNDIAIIKILLAAGADIMLLNGENKCALQMSCELEDELLLDMQKLILHELPKKVCRSEEIGQVLIDAGCHVYHAVHLKNARVLEYMLNRGYPVDCVYPATNQTALHIAISLRDVDGVKLLLKYGADVEAKDCFGSTPILYVYHFDVEHSSEKIEILQILLSARVSLTSCNDKDLFQAGGTLARGNDQAVGILLQSYIDFTAIEKTSENNILHYLAVNKNPGVVDQVKLHTDKYCDVNLGNHNGLTPLHIAVGYANANMVEFLLSQGAKTTCVEKLRIATPIYFAYSSLRHNLNEHTEQCVQLLLQHNADPQCIFKDGHREFTVFNIAIGKKRFNSLNPVVARLAISEGLGTPIIEMISTKIKACEQVQQYFNKCRNLLRRKLFGTATLFKLLTSDDKQMAGYLNKKKLVLKLIDPKYIQRLTKFYPYYYNTLRKRLIRGTLRYKGATVICQSFKCRRDDIDVIVEKIIDLLDDEVLRQLSTLSTLSHCNPDLITMQIEWKMTI